MEGHIVVIGLDTFKIKMFHQEASVETIKLTFKAVATDFNQSLPNSYN